MWRSARRVRGERRRQRGERLVQRSKQQAAAAGFLFSLDGLPSMHLISSAFAPTVVHSTTSRAICQRVTPRPLPPPEAPHRRRRRGWRCRGRRLGTRQG